MEKSLFIGMIFQKKRLTYPYLRPTNLQVLDYKQFENSKEGCVALLKWVKSLTKEPSASWLYTGLYCICLSEFLFKKGSLFG